MQDGALANRTERQTEWQSVNWRVVNRRVRTVRQRIFRATQQGEWEKVQSLQRLMLRSYANTLVSVRRVTQVNTGKRTAGVDKLVVKTPEARGRLVDHLMTAQPWKAQPTKRVVAGLPAAAAGYPAVAGAAAGGGGPHPRGP